MTFSSFVRSVVLLILFVLSAAVNYLWNKSTKYVRRNSIESTLVIGICVNTALNLFHSASKDPNQFITLSDDLVMNNLSPLLLTLVFHSDWKTSCICLFLAIIPFAFKYLQAGSIQTLSAGLCYICFCLFMIYEYKRQNLSKFLLAQNLQLAIEENERMSDELHANEMSHMIGNVAHDLKTVSFAYHNIFFLII
jgi:hypothetical protein